MSIAVIRDDRDRISEKTGVVKNSLYFAELTTALDKVHRAGMPGVFAEVRDGEQTWCGAAGVSDLRTGRPITLDMRHRVGSITKTFTAAAVLQQVESRQIGLDTPIGATTCRGWCPESEATQSPCEC